jgi:ABC-type glucose/galactose transport system permease subunit
MTLVQGVIMFFLPDWIYKALPYVYVLVGAVALSGTDFSAGRLSGLLLIMAAALILKMRDHSDGTDNSNKS